MTLCVIILHKADAESLQQRLKELHQADQLIVIDDPSEDSEVAKKLCKKYGAEFIQREVHGDFSAQRNFAVAQSTQDWTLFVDVDEQVSPELWDEIKTCITQTTATGVWIDRRDIFMGKHLKHGETGSMRLLRLARTKAGLGKWQRGVHEFWSVAGPHDYLSAPLLHQPHKTFSEFLQKIQYYASLEPGNRKKLSRRKVAFELLTYPAAKFCKAIFWQAGWQDGMVGWIHAFGMAYWSLLVRVYCWEAWYVDKK